jgi:hypothetical protein
MNFLVARPNKTDINSIVDHWDRVAIEDDIRTIEELLDCDAFSPKNGGSPLFKAAFIQLLIALRDLMYKAAKYASPISFTDDVTITEAVEDVSGLIKFVRNALCHPDSDHHFLVKGAMKATFNVCFGATVVLDMGDIKISSPYDDDICFFFGEQRIFLRRHVSRAFEEAKGKLLPLLYVAGGH